MRCVKMSKKILVVGGGGREHAIIKALKKSPDCGEVWCAPGNGGIGYDAHCVNIKATDVERTAQVFDILLGDNLAGRKEHIAQHGAEYLDDLDVS